MVLGIGVLSGHGGMGARQGGWSDFHVPPEHCSWVPHGWQSVTS
jgi:hypothetical protein